MSLSHNNKFRRVGISNAEVTADEPINDPVILYGVKAAVEARFPELWDTFDAAVSVVASMSLSGRQRPLSLILEGWSGIGKSAVIRSLFPHRDYDLREYVYRSDSWSSKSFVTHSQSMKKTQLKKIDMLPKLKDKVLLTKELATLFRGNVHQLEDSFKNLIAVLDGEGFTSDSGTHGQRGYEERIIFNWIGGTTPLPDATYQLMSQLGNRLLFWEVPAVTPAESSVRDYILGTGRLTDEDTVQERVNAFLSAYFAGNPVGGTDPKSIAFSDALADELGRWGKLIIHGRAVVNYEKVAGQWTPVSANPPEGIWRVLTYLRELALGHCLAHGRDYVDESDLAIVAHTAVSTVPAHLRPLIRALSIPAARVETGDAMDLCNVSHPTARRYLRELELLGFADLEKGTPSTHADLITLSPTYSWMVRDLEQ